MHSLRRSISTGLDLAERLIELRDSYPELDEVRPSDPRIVEFLGALQEVGLDLPAVEPGAEAVASALGKLGTALGLGRTRDDELDHLFAHWTHGMNAGSGGATEVEHALVVAEETRRLRDEIVAEIGAAANRLDVTIELGADLGSLLGQSRPGVVQLGPRFDPFAREGRALLTHELVHEAQRSLRGAADVARAEHEAESIMREVMRGGVARAPEVALPPGVYAGCGPQAMAEKREEEEQREEEREGEREGERKREGERGGGRVPDPVPPGPPPPRAPTLTRDPAPEPAPPPSPVPIPTLDIATNDCAVPCADPIAEHRLEPIPKQPPAAPKGEGEARTLTIAGHKIQFRLPKDAKAGRVTVRFRQADTPFQALTLKTATLTLTEDLRIRSGQLHASVKLGKFITVPNAVLTVGARGQVAAYIRGAKVQIGSVVSGKVDLNLGPGGIEGNGQFKFNEFRLSNGIRLTSGMAQVAVTKGGSVSAHGAFELQFGEHLKANLDLCMVDGDVRGALTVELTAKVPIVPKLLHATRISATGCYSEKTGVSLHGEVDVEVRDWLKGKLSADVHKPPGAGVDWSVAGELSLAKPFSLATLTIDDASVRGRYAKGSFAPFEGELHYHTESLQGKALGTLDVQSGKLNGVGEVDIMAPIDVGPFSLEEGHLEAHLVDNEPTEIIGQMKAALKMNGVPTFEVDCQEAVYVVATKELHARGDLNVLHDVVIGSADALHATIPACNAGSFAVENSALVNLGARVPVHVDHGANAIGVGSIGFSYSEAAGLSGDLDFNLVGRAGLPSYEAGPLYLLPGGSFTAAVVDSTPQEAAASDVQWELVNPTNTGKVCGQVSGRYDFGTKTGALEGMAFIAEPWVVALPFGILTFKSGDGAVKVGATIERLQANAFAFDLAVTSGPLGAFTLEGAAEGAFDPEQGGFDGTFSAKLAAGALAVPTSGPIGLTVKGGALDGAITKQALAGPLHGSLDVDVTKDQAPFLDGQITSAALDLDRGQISGDGNLSLSLEKDLAALGVVMPAAVSGRLLPGSGISATIAANELSALSGTVLTMFGMNGADVAQGDLALHWDLASNCITGDVYGNLLGDVPLTESAGESIKAWGVTLAGGSQVALKLGVQGLERCDVQLGAHLTQGGELVAHGDVQGQWLFGATDDLSGRASVSLLKDVPLASIGRFAVVIGQETTAEVTLEASQLVSGNGSFVLGLNEGTRKASLTLSAEVADTLNGAADLVVHENIRLGIGALGDTEFGVDISTETGGQVVVLDNQPTHTQGTLALDVTGNGIPFARGRFDVQADLAAAESPVDASGEVEVIQSFDIGESTDFALSLHEGTTGRAVITQSALSDLDGQLCLGLRHKAVGEVGTMTIGGHYHGGQRPSLNGQANVALTRGFQVFDAGPYGFGLAPSSFSASVVDSDIVAVTGQFGLWAEQRGRDDEAPLGTVEVALNGSFVRPPGAAAGIVSGSGGITVKGDFEVAQAGPYQLVVSSGTSATVTIEANRFVKVEGGIKGRVDQLDQPEPQLLALEGQVSYVPANGGQVDAVGAVRMLGRRKLVNVGSYSLWLAPGVAPTGATIVIEKNDIKSLSGAIGAEVHDAKGPLFEVTVVGAWDAENDLSGMGVVRLARPLTFPEGASGARIEVLSAEGSAAVAQSKLQSFSGQADAIVYDDDGQLVRISGDATFDPVNGKLQHAHGAVELLRPIAISDQIVIASMAATATIENDALSEATGDITVRLPHLGEGVTVTLTGGWARGEGGADDVYWGSGELDFVAVDDPSKGRKLAGQVGVTVGKDGHWQVDGKLDWQLTPKIGGKVGMRMDDDLDPVIDASIAIAPFQLLPGRKLFEKETKLFHVAKQVKIVVLTVGATLGMGLAMKPTMASIPRLSAEEWRPLSGGRQQVPTFTADMAVTSGLDFWLELAPYLEIGIGVTNANVAIGVRAGLRLDVPVDLNANAELRGGPEGFSGKLGVGVGIEPTLSLNLLPYIIGRLYSFPIAKHELPEKDIDLGKPFSFNWGKTYTFGDQQRSEPGAISQHAEGESKPQPVLRKDPKPTFERAGDAPASEPGAPQIESKPGDDQTAEGDGGTGDKLKKLIEAADAIGEFGEAIGDYLDGSPKASNVTEFVTQIEERERGLSDKTIAWHRVARAGKRLFDIAVTEIPDLRYDIPLFVWDIIKNPDNPPDLLEAWAGEDDNARAIAINAAALGELPTKGLVQLGAAMLRGSCGDEDEVSLFLLLSHAQNRGCLKEVVDGLGGFQRLNDNLDGSERQLFQSIYRDLGYAVD